MTPSREALVMRVPVLALTLLAGGSAAFANTWHVSPDGSGDAATIQQAISLAADGDIVELGDGTFTGTGNYDVDFLGKDIIVRSASNYPLGCVVDVQGSPAAPHRAFVFQHGEPRSAIVRGITITGGYLVAIAPPNSGGGVLCASSSSPSFQNCVFLANSASNGGAVAVESGSGPAFWDCTFTSNAAVDLPYSGVRGWGGALQLRSAAWMPASAEFLRCRFTGNTSARNGSALTAAGVHVSIAECVFEDNAGGGSAVDLGSFEIPTVVANCSFARNTSSPDGSGAALGCFRIDVDVISCTFSGNGGGYGGGGVSLYGCDADVVDCTFEGNVSRRGGGLHLAPGTTALVQDCVFVGNGATGTGASNDGGGGAYVDYGSHGSFERCTFARNTASLQGGALYDWSSSEVTNCTVIGNSAPTGGGVYFSDRSSASVLTRSIVAFGGLGPGITCDGSEPTIACSDLFGNAGGDTICGIDGGGNLSADPLFCSRESDDYHLQWGSPCLPANSDCGLIGRFGFGGCNSVSVAPNSWAKTKSQYR